MSQLEIIIKDIKLANELLTRLVAGSSVLQLTLDWSMQLTRGANACFLNPSYTDWKGRLLRQKLPRLLQYPNLYLLLLKNKFLDKRGDRWQDVGMTICPRVSLLSFKFFAKHSFVIIYSWSRIILIPSENFDRVSVEWTPSSVT